MGLLNFGDDALNQGLLGLGAGLLQGSSGHYGQFGPALGLGIQGFQGGIQNAREMQMRKQQQDMLQKLQQSQILENESQNKKRQFEMDQALRLQQERARVLGMAAPQQIGTPSGLGGFVQNQPPLQMPSGATPPIVPQQSTVLPPAMAAAEGDLLGSQIRQAAPDIPTTTAPTVGVNSNKLSLLQNPDRLRALATQLQNIGAHQDATYYTGLADKVEAQQKAERAEHDKIQVDAQGVPRFVRNGMPVFTGDLRKAPEGMQYNEAGQLEAIPGFLDMKKQIAAAGKPEVSVAVNSKEQTEEAKAVGKFQGEQYADIQKAGFNAQGKIDKFNRLDQLLDGVQTGKLTPLGTDIAAYAKSLGFNIDDKLPNKQAAAALINAMALELRNPSGGAGMPGAMSDADRQYLTTMVPSLAGDPEGRKKLIETGRKLAQRDKDVARLARDYRKKNGGMNEGFYDVLEEYSAKNPLFSTAASSPEVQKLLDKYK